MREGGIVLCGGQSKRMGRPKAWLPFGGELMLPRVVRLLHRPERPVVVVAAQEQELPPLPAEVGIVRDEEPARGPLQGLAAGLAALHDRADAVFLSSCDVPFLRPALVARLFELLGAHSICVPRVGERYHPLAAVYRVEVLDHVRALLSQDRLRPVFLFERVPTRVVVAEELRASDPTLQSLRNLNTSEEYAQALRDATSGAC